MRRQLITVLFSLCLVGCTSKNISLQGTYWIPFQVSWEDLGNNNQNKIASFKTVFFNSDTAFYVLSSYNGKANLLDSLAYGVEPDFSVYRGSAIRKNDLIVLSYKKIYGYIVEGAALLKVDTIHLKEIENGFLKFEGTLYVKTRHYTDYSIKKMRCQIEIAEIAEKSPNILVPVE